ncbi:hypothetical protein K3495_g13043 [Podosphaera aphanis]|nr:hypothetical protein K3495_g13043 [Podosphaera aphanis]
MSLGGVSPFFATHGYHVSPIQKVAPESKVPTSTGKERADNFVQSLSQITTFMQAAMAAVQQRFKEQADKNRQPAPRYSIGDKVWLLLRNIKLDGQPSRKLAWQHAKYIVTRIISPEVVELNITGKIHNRFHVDMLLPADDNPLPSQQIEDQNPGPVIQSEDSNEDEYAVDKILQCKTWKGERQALVKWSGYPKPEWTSLVNVQETEALDKWEEIWGSAESCNGPPTKKRRRAK